MSVEFSAQERALLEHIQQDFPLSHDPYGELGDAVGCSREEAHETVQSLRARGIIRRIGGSFAAGKLGYVSVLVAARIATDQLAAVAERVNAFPEVTHNYERNGSHNLWFTIIAENTERLEYLIDVISNYHGVHEVHVLPAEKMIKIRVDFPFTGGEHALG